MKKFTVHTMGCKSNQFEGAVIKQDLETCGYEEVNNIENADFYILNSCSVTHNSDKEAMYLLRNAKNKNPKINKEFSRNFVKNRISNPILTIEVFI